MEVKITKNKTVVDKDNLFTYVYEFFHNGEFVKKDIIKIPPTDYMTPDESSSVVSEEALRSNLEQLLYNYEFDIEKISVIIEEI
jgi:hypothetical protein